MFSSLLIANRGEIAVRIVRTCRRLGIRSIAVFSDADADALYVRLADTAVRIGPAAPAESYLSIDAILSAARESAAEAIHPGYGFLSENADFARAVREAGLILVGPSPETMDRLGDKSAARTEALASGLALIPGSPGAVSPDEAARLAPDLGFPLAVKASFGGGGRGIRIAHTPDDLAPAISSATNEATLAFGSGAVYLERYLPHVRHVEVQVIADTQGTVLTLGDRDCTVQRRSQKLIEEAPAPDLPSDIRKAMTQGAAEMTRRLGYHGAATFEFLYDPTAQAAYFLEINTRLQVEHCVTEMICGLDLVELQLIVASGAPLPITQGDVALQGHAIEARIVAEDPRQGFRPVPGPVTRLHLPSGPFVRTDFGVAQGDAIPTHYDSLLGKIIVWGPDRQSATTRLRAALDEFVLDGVPTTAPALGLCLSIPAFQDMAHGTTSLDTEWRDLFTDLPESDPQPAPRATPPVERWVSIATDRGMIDLVLPLRGTAASTSKTAGPRRQADETGPQPTADLTTAPMDGTVTGLFVEEGEILEDGALIAVLEAMKMEIPLRANGAGRVDRIRVSKGEAITAGTRLFDISRIDGEMEM